MTTSDNVSVETLFVRPSAPTGWRLLRYALLCSFVGFLVSLHAFSVATLPHILTPDGFNFQGVTEGLPVPRLLAWNSVLISLLQAYTSLNPMLLAGGGLLLTFFLWTRTLHVVFPMLHLFHPMPNAVTEGESASAVADTHTVVLDSRLLLRVAGLFVLVALPLVLLLGLGLFAVTRFPKTALVLQACWFMAVGIRMRTALRPGGFVARTLFPSEFPSRRGPAFSPVVEAFIGVVFGLLVFLLQRIAMPLPAPDVLRSLHALGTFHIARWSGLAVHYLLSVSLVCFGVGLLFVLFAPFYARPFPRLLQPALIALTVLCGLLALGLPRPYTSQSLAARWDITPPIMLTAFPYNPRNPASGVPDGIEAGTDLARLAGVALGNQPSSPDHRFLLFTPVGIYTALQHGYTEDGLTADLTSVPKIEAFLQRRAYNTSLSWTAFKHIYNVGNVHFDSTLALRACLEDLQRYPHASVVTHSVRDMLFTISASPENLALLDDWADESRFEHADRPCLKLMGDLYLRFGEQKKALEWYARAEMPRSFMAEMRANKPLFHAGQIQGTVLWNGKPLAGISVGAFPYLQNGLPKDLEGQVRDAERQLMPLYPYSKRFRWMEPRPYSFRWMSAGTVTDSAGRFTLSYLTEGTYHLVCTLPPTIVLKPFRDERLHSRHASGDISLRYGKPTAELGNIELNFTP